MINENSKFIKYLIFLLFNNMRLITLFILQDRYKSSMQLTKPNLKNATKCNVTLAIKDHDNDVEMAAIDCAWKL